MTRSVLTLLILAWPLVAQTAAPVVALPSAKPFVWIVDGAGDLKGCSTSLTKSLAKEAEFEAYAWSHGHRRIVLDQTDHQYARLRGEQLAEKIQERRRKEPDRRVVLVAHSAGAAVALAAAEALPKDGLHRLVLLAPSVASQYDPRLAAAACREGIDVFISSKDIWALGIGVSLVGTIDGHRATSAAGRYGFDLDCQAVRTVSWSKDDAKLGHTGGHYGAYAPDYARKNLLPLIVGK